MTGPGRTRGARALLAVAAISALPFLAVHLLGWRSDVAVLSGNLAEPGSAMRGAIYLLTWMLGVLVAPSAALGALLDVATERVGRFLVESKPQTDLVGGPLGGSGTGDRRLDRREDPQERDRRLDAPLSPQE